jgi:hypothetical protein
VAETGLSRLSIEGVGAMAGLVLIGIIVVMLLVLLVQLFRKKPVKKLLLSFGLILGGYHLYVTYTCGPNRADIKVMKPQAEAITAYILKNGIPESMADTPDLPYVLENCKWTKKNVEWCSFKVDDKKYSLELYNISTLYITIYNDISKTGIHYMLRQNEKKWYFVESKVYSTKKSGICNPMRM